MYNFKKIITFGMFCAVLIFVFMVAGLLGFDNLSLKSFLGFMKSSPEDAFYCIISSIVLGVFFSYLIDKAIEFCSIFSSKMDKIGGADSGFIIFSSKKASKYCLVSLNKKTKKITVINSIKENNLYRGFIIHGSSYYSIKRVYKSIASSMEKDTPYETVLILAKSMCSYIEEVLFDEKGVKIELPSEVQLVGSSPKEIIRKININTCTLAELNSVPYISERLALKIIDYRNSHLPFESFESFCRIFDIKGNQIYTIKKHIYVGRMKELPPIDKKDETSKDRRVDF